MKEAGSRAAPVGVRAHKYRSVVLAALAAQKSPVSAQSLHAALRNDGQRVGLSTVYRELHALAQSRHIKEAFVGGETVYRVSDRDLLVCDECGRTKELGIEPALGGALDEFFGVGRPITVHGMCSACAAAG